MRHCAPATMPRTTPSSARDVPGAVATAVGSRSRAPTPASATTTTKSETTRGVAAHGGDAVRRIAGGALSRSHSGAYASNGGLLVTNSRDALRVYDVARGRVVRELATRDARRVTASPYARSIVVCGSSDGTLTVWDVETGKMQRKYEFPFEIVDVVYPGGECGKDCVFVSARAREDGGGRVYRVSLMKGKIVEHLAKMSAPCMLTCSASGAYVACVERRTVYVWGVGKERGGNASRALKMHRTKDITALAFSHDDETLAVGDSTGRIVMFHGFARAVKNLQNEAQGEKTEVNGDALPSTTSHWHSRAVGCLHFSGDGAHLFSGGEEAVLVIWNLQDGKKTYLPRLGAPLKSIVSQRDDPSRLALFGSDNAVRLVNVASLSVEGTIQGVRPAVLDGERQHYTSAVVYDPRADLAVLSAAGAALQFYDYARDDHVADLAVAPRNYVNTSDEVDSPMESHVAHAAFSRDGRVLLTVDRRSDQPLEVTHAIEETLKIWERVDADVDDDDDVDDDENIARAPGGAFTCVAQCELPHNGLITCVGVRPGAHTLHDAMAFTGGSDGEFKIWVPNGRAARGGEHAGWRCRSSAAHPSGDAITAGAFSADGSIVASAASEIVLWDPASNAKLATLAAPKSSALGEPASAIKSVAFVAGEPLFAACDGKQLVIWNLQTLQPWRVFAMPCVDLNAHPTLPTLAATFAYDDDDHDSNDDDSNGKKKKCFIVRFVGGDAAPAGAYACADGAPSAVLFPPGNRALEASTSAASAAMVVVTRDRQFIRIGVETNREARMRDDMDIDAAAPAVTKYFTGGVVLAGAPPNPKLAEYLADARKRVEALDVSKDDDDTDDIPARDRVIGGKFGGVGKAPWGELFDAPSHELPPLISLCPHFMHAMLSRQRADDDE